MPLFMAPNNRVDSCLAAAVLPLLCSIPPSANGDFCHGLLTRKGLRPLRSFIMLCGSGLIRFTVCPSICASHPFSPFFFPSSFLRMPPSSPRTRRGGTTIVIPLDVPAPFLFAPLLFLLLVCRCHSSSPPPFFRAPPHPPPATTTMVVDHQRQDSSSDLINSWTVVQGSIINHHLHQSAGNVDGIPLSRCCLAAFCVPYHHLQQASSSTTTATSPTTTSSRKNKSKKQTWQEGNGRPLALSLDEDDHHHLCPLTSPDFSFVVDRQRCEGCFLSLYEQSDPETRTTTLIPIGKATTTMYAGAGAEGGGKREMKRERT